MHEDGLDSSQFVHDTDTHDVDDLFELGNEDHRVVSTTDVLAYFDRVRRGARVYELVANELQERDLEMFPSIEEADYYGQVQLRRLNSRPADDSPSVDNQPEVASVDLSLPDSGAVARGSFLSSLKPDAQELDSLGFGMSVADAMERMRSRGRTKMPLFFDESDKTTLIGTVALKDINMDALTLDSTRLVELAQTQVPVVRTNEKLSDWIPAILQYGFIYGRDLQHKVVQIYTVRDLATHLNSISQMFLRVHELEELLRGVLGKVGETDLEAARGQVANINSIQKSDKSGPLFNQSDLNRKGQFGDERFVETLTFADYMKCLSRDEIWNECFEPESSGFSFDRDRCLQSLNEARIARNSVMHISRQEVLETLTPSLECLAVWLRQVK